MMESLFKIQLDNKKNIDKGRINFKKSPKERITKSYIETRLESLEEQWQNFSSTHRKIVEKATASDEKHSYFVNEVYDSTEETYISYKTELKECFTNLISTNVPNIQSATKTSSNVKLPKITIPIFSGNYREWTSFRDLFVSLVHNNDSIDKVQKLHYLKSNLTGEAEQLLKHTPVTASNYDECWSILNKRYDNKRFLSNSMLTRFINQPNIVTESSSAIKELLDTTVDCLHGLRTLGIDVSSWDVIVIHIASAKLDSESRKLWESKISSFDKLPTFDEFKEFLESRFRSLEFLDTKQTRQRSTASKPRVLHSTTSENSSIQLTCKFCNGQHKLSNCKLFSKEDVNNRRNFVQTKSLCFNCLGANHSIKYCRAKTSCQICNRRHHSLLHLKPSVAISSGSSPEATSAGNSAASTSHVATDTVQEPIVSNHFSRKAVPNQVLLATALVMAETGNGYKQLLRALLDQGSQASFITESAVQLLGLKKTPVRSIITGIGGDESPLASKFIVHVRIHSRHDPSFQIDVKAYVLGKITSLLPSDKVVLPTWPELDHITLADPGYHTPSKIDVLLGAEVYGQVITEGLIRNSPGSIIAQNSTLGWILSGQTHRGDQSHCHNAVVSMHSQVNDNEILRKFWEIESDVFSSKKRLTEEEQQCEEYFAQTTTRDSDGRYVVRLPFRQSDLPEQTREIAIKRFLLLENKFKRDPELKQRYTEVIQEYLDLGHMEIVPTKTDDVQLDKAVYLPHHAVIREDKLTTKLRVVFDASAKGRNGISLNDVLMVGPIIQPELRHLILKWRTFPIVLCADIVKMYRQVAVASVDTDFQRIVWRDDPASEIKDYKLLRVTFGTASAPYLAVKSLQQLAHDEGDMFPLVSEKVKQEFYVDDFMSGCQTVEEGKRINEEMNTLLEKGGFQLQKWMTNNEELLKEISGKDGGNQKETLKIRMDELVKILGLTWDRKTDSFTYRVAYPQQSEKLTKRSVISEISRLFDPLGWAAPCIITAKVMIQKLWLAGIDWDEELPTELYNEWQTCRSDLEKTHQFVIPRWLETRTDDVVTELHGFSDASNMAYAAVVYLRTIDVDGVVRVNLVTAKTRVAPVKQVSIPRLELMGAVLLAKLISEVAEVLAISKENIHCWTDSTVVLAWLSNHPSRWTTFVGNRVSDILTHVENTQWAHVTSTSNPADISSRGMTPEDLSKSNLWRHGPTWLQEKLVNYVRPKSISTNAEMRATKKINVHAVCAEDTLPLWTKYSSLNKLIRVVAYCCRFLYLKHKKESYLTSKELTNALNICIKQCQEQEFKEEIESIKKNENISKKSKLRPLCPILDDNGILRIGGRINNAPISEDMRHPIILPQHSHLTSLIVDEAHKSTLHGGPTIMLNYLRSKYWVISAKSVVKAYVRKCVVCVRHSANCNSQLMGQLPSCRVTPSRAFLRSGVDFAGPINIRISKGRGNKSYKGYICLFVCMATKAVHLEAISDLTSQAFIAGFRRFVARRGHCNEIWSDNGTNFVGAAKELQLLVAAEKSSVASEIQGWLSMRGVTWHFIPPHAPNFGGLWEAGIKSTKFHLKRVIGSSTLTYEEMATLLSQIEACLNSRPISQISQDPEDPIPLTPGHFLIGEPLLLVPSRNYSSDSISGMNRWQLLQRMTRDFWCRWQQDYLAHLMQRYKWALRETEPNIGDIVLVKEDNLPPGRWLLGKIIAKHPGLDGINRVVTLKSNNVEIKRPTSKLCILPVAN